jgi:hypothetical protein
MEFSRRADLSLLGERARELRNQGRVEQTEKAVDTVTPGRLPLAQPMSLTDRSIVLRYGGFPDSKYPPSNSIHGPKDMERKAAPGTQVENLERHEASTVPTRGLEDLNSQRIGMGLKHRRDLKSEGKWFKDASFRRDEISALRMEVLGIEEEDYPITDLGNAAAYHKNDDFIQQTLNTLPGAFREAVLVAEGLVDGTITGKENPLPGVPLPRNQATQLLWQLSQRQNGDVPLPAPLPRGQATFRRESVKYDTTALAHPVSPESGSEGLGLRDLLEESPRVYNFRESRTRNMRRSRPGLSSMTRPNRRGPWLPEEDETLRQLVSAQGLNNWVLISQHMQHRSPKQCRERYHQNLKPSLNHEPISAQEGELIEQMVNDIGKRWPEIARRLRNRSDNAVKNWWNESMNRRRRNAIQHSGREDTARHGDAFGTQSDGEGDPIDLGLTLSRMPSTQKPGFPEIEASPHTSTQRGLGSDSDNRGLHPYPAPHPNAGRQSLQAHKENITEFNSVPDFIMTTPEWTSISVENLSANVTEDELRSAFQGFGDIIRVEMPPGEGHGLIEFVDHQAAELAFYQMEGSPIGGSCVHLRWGSSYLSRLERLPLRPPSFQLNDGTYVNGGQRWGQELKEMDLEEEEYLNTSDDGEELNEVGLIKSFGDENKPRKETIHNKQLWQALEGMKRDRRRLRAEMLMLKGTASSSFDRLVDLGGLSDDEGDRKAADPTTDHDVMFITHTISEDRTGNQEGITRKRLAALGARCVQRISRPEAEELLVTPKPKGPVDVEKQCGVLLPNGQPCARSLTCKSHSTGAKRAVPGRSLPYDMLLQAYQNQAKGRLYPGMHTQQATQAKAQQAQRQREMTHQ